MSNMLLGLIIVIALIVVYLVYQPTKIAKPQNVLLFYRNGCPFCDVFKPEWAKVEFTLKDKAKKYDTSEPRNSILASQYKVSGVPSIILIDHTGAYETYLGSRTADDIIARMV